MTETVPYPEDDPDEPTMQTRCPHCLGEQWAMTVIAFSQGMHGCTCCGKLTTPMTDAQWRAALRRKRQALADERTGNAGARREDRA